MAEVNNPTIASGERVATMTGTPDKGQGTVGLETQLPGSATTVSEQAKANGGIGPGNLIEDYVDKKLFEFESDDTPLMQLMLNAKKVPVTSPIVQHYMLDEAKSSVTTNAACGGNNASRAVLPLEAADATIPRPYMTLVCLGVDGYDRTGQTKTVGRWLMLFVVGFSEESNSPIVLAVNGPKANATDETCQIPEIPANTECIICANACYETQKVVDPDGVTPVAEELYLQKSILTQIISDYWASQEKRIPFDQAILAEHALKTFKQRCNRKLWIGRNGHFTVMGANGTGAQEVYCTEGVRWQFKRELAHSGQWTYDEFVALAKLIYTGEDIPGSVYCLCGKNFLESIQKIDWSKHPEVRIEVKTNNLGWSITAIHTVFGELQFKREPTLDRIGYSNSCGIFGEGRLVHYSRTSEHQYNEKVEQQEATRNGLITWDALGLKGSCHIWVDGEGSTLGGDGSGSTAFELWTETTAPENPVEGTVYVFEFDCQLTDDLTAVAGEMYQYTGGKWVKYTGSVYAG